MCDNRVAVCRDHANGICGRQKCKYYHIPIIVPPAPVMAAILHQHSDPPPGTEDQSPRHHQPTPDADVLELSRGRAAVLETVARNEVPGLDAIDGTCTNSITTSELSLLDAVSSASSSATLAREESGDARKDEEEQQKLRLSNISVTYLDTFRRSIKFLEMAKDGEGAKESEQKRV